MVCRVSPMSGVQGRAWGRPVQLHPSASTVSPRRSAGDSTVIQPPRRESSSPTIQYLCGYVALGLFTYRGEDEDDPPNCRLPTCQLQPPRDTSWSLCVVTIPRVKLLQRPPQPVHPLPPSRSSQLPPITFSQQHWQHPAFLLLLTYPRTPVSPPSP